MSMHGFWSAIGFLTRLPIPDTPYNDDTVRASMRWYPVAGLIVGVIVAGSLALWQQVFPGSPLLAGVMTVATWVALTGALHLDGLADTIDAWVGGLGDRERTLAIMKDPHVGSSAVVWLCLFLVAKVAVVASAMQGSHAFAALIMACVWARLAPLWLFRLTPYVRARGLGSAMQGALTLSQLTGLTVAVALLSVWLLPPVASVLGFGAILLVFSGLRQWMLHRLGGTTGDTAGALIELTEFFFLLTLVAVNA